MRHARRGTEKPNDAIVRIYTDGAARHNPDGHSASGYIAYDANGKLLGSGFSYIGITTNNKAEYTAIINALEWCMNSVKNPASTTVELYSDSELVINQLNGVYKVRAADIVPMHRIVIGLARGFGAVRFVNVRRTEPHIRLVDKRLNVLLDAI